MEGGGRTTERKEAIWARETQQARMHRQREYVNFIILGGVGERWEKAGFPISLPSYHKAQSRANYLL